MLFPILLPLLAVLPYISAATMNYRGLETRDHKTPSLPLPSQNIFQFGSNGTWIENIAVRPNGDLLLTMLAPNASLYTVKRPYAGSREFSLVHTFDGATGLLGITEICHDTFALLSLNSLNATNAESGSTDVWVVSPRTRGVWDVKKAASLSDIVVPNGITSVPGSSAVLIADSIGGSVTRCDIRTGACTPILSGPEFAPVPNDSARPIGINGIHYRAGYIYWSHSGLVSIFRRQVDSEGYPVNNSGTELVGTINDVQFVDDFTEDAAGRFWAATYLNNSVVLLERDGTSEIVVGSPNESTVGGCTSAAFGRTAPDRKMLYVVTSGEDGKEPAKIVAVDTSVFGSK
jgi:sugar lactone lactonase YvrE